MRPRTRVPLAWLMTAALLVSGCASKSGSKDGDGPTGVPPTAPTATHGEDTCAIAGLVLDEEVNPLPEAQVGLLELAGVTVHSAGDGGFAFSDLPPGAYNVAASKPSYDSEVKRIECPAGERVHVTLSLVKVPDPAQPYSRPYQEKGHIGCSVGFLSVSTADFCKQLNIDSNGKTIFPFKADPIPVTGLFVEMTWSATGAFGGTYLSLTYPAMNAKQPQIQVGPNNKLRTGSIVTGKSPILLRAEAIDPSDPIYTSSDANVTRKFEVRAAGSDLSTNPLDDGSSKLVVGQDFELRFVLYYAGDPVPPL